VYEIALTVSACLRAGTRVDVAWAVQTRDFGTPAPGDANEALALTPGGGRIGGVVGGAANDQLAQFAGGAGRLVTLTIADFEAQLAGLPRGGEARCLVVPAPDLPAQLWDRLRDRDPVCLVTRLAEGDRVAGVRLYDPGSVAEAGEAAARLFGAGVSGTLVADGEIVSVFWPVPSLVIVGGGPVAEALAANARLLGWRVQPATDASAATGLIAGLSRLDNIVVVAHDLELAGQALQAALGSEAGYIGALGSRKMQETRADWLAYRGVTDTSRVHGPAGLDIGARTHAEIAVAILAEALSLRA
jgi:xanthine dehydrogenase accessory factor